VSDRPTQALEWALKQRYTSVAARYAKEIATYTVQLEAEIEQLKKDQEPFIAQITQRKTYEVRCRYCERTPSEAESGFKCSTCNQGGNDASS